MPRSTSSVPQMGRPEDDTGETKKDIIPHPAVVAAIAIVLAGRSLYLHYQSIKEAPIQQDVPDTSQTQSDSSVFAQTSPDKPLYVLLLGTDGGDPQQANFVGVAAINKAKKHIDIIMLPDDTKIEGRKEKGIQELQDVYSEGGMSLVRAVVEDIFHIPIPYYATFTADSFSKMVDLSGGVPIYVEKNMYHGDEATGEDRHQPLPGLSDPDREGSRRLYALYRCGRLSVADAAAGTVHQELL